MEYQQKFAVFFSEASKGRKWGAVLSWLAALALVIAMVVPGFSVKSKLSDLVEIFTGETSSYEQMIDEMSEDMPEETKPMVSLLTGQNTSVLSYLTKYDAPVHVYEAQQQGETESSSGNWAGLALFALLVLFILCNVLFSAFTMNILSFLMAVGAIAEIILVYLLRFRMPLAAILSADELGMVLSFSYPMHLALIVSLAAAAVLQLVGLILHYSAQDEETEYDEYHWNDGGTEGRDLETGLVEKDDSTEAIQQAVAVLVQLNTGKTFEIYNNSQVILGKGSQADIIIANPVISRMHAKIVCNNNKCMLEDMGSKNGTFLNEQQLQPGVSVVLSDGVYVTLGNEVLQFKV